MYECRRRSLRVKGLEPEEKGFDYYSSSRTPRKQREKEEEEEEEEEEGEGEEKEEEVVEEEEEEGKGEGEGEESEREEDREGERGSEAVMDSGCDGEQILESGYDEEEEEEKEEEDERRKRRRQTPRNDTSTENIRFTSSRRSKRRRLDRTRTTDNKNTRNRSEDQNEAEESEEEEEAARETREREKEYNETPLADSSSRSSRYHRRTRSNTDTLNTPNDSQSSASSTIISIQRNMRRNTRVKNRLFTRSRVSPARTRGSGERCNDDVIVVATTEEGGTRENERCNHSHSSRENSTRNGMEGVELIKNSSSRSPPDPHGRSSSLSRSSRVASRLSPSVYEEISTRSRGRTIFSAAATNDENSDKDSTVIARNDVTARRGKSHSITGDVVSSGRGVGGGGGGGEVMCNGVTGSPLDLWAGQGEGDGCGVSDVLVDMETESLSSHGERNSNSKSTHSVATATTIATSTAHGRGQVHLNSKSTPTTTTTTSNSSSRRNSNSNPNLKSAPSISTAMHIAQDSVPLSSPLTTSDQQPPSHGLNREEEDDKEEEEVVEVEIDSSQLLAVLQRVVDETEKTCVEVMEKMLSTFNHLVFRYRMKADRRQLPKVRIKNISSTLCGVGVGYTMLLINSYVIFQKPKIILCMFSCWSNSSPSCTIPEVHVRRKCFISLC